MDRKSIIQVLEAIIEKDKADGCNDCVYEKVEEWEMPCAKCARNCKDYFRWKNFWEKDGE